MKGVGVWSLDCIIIEDKNSGQGKVTQIQTILFKPSSMNCFFILIALKLNQNFMDCLMIRSRGSMRLHR